MKLYELVICETFCRGMVNSVKSHAYIKKREMSVLYTSGINSPIVTDSV